MKGKCQISLQKSTILYIHHIYNNEVSVNTTAECFILNLFPKLPELSMPVSKNNLQLELGTLVASCNKACSKYQQQSTMYITKNNSTHTQVRKHMIYMTLKCLGV